MTPLHHLKCGFKGNEIVPLIKSQLFEPYNMPRQKLPKVLWQTGLMIFLGYYLRIKSNQSQEIKSYFTI